jgi:(S)-2-hydroxyglutarate dehydrogenase
MRYDICVVGAGLIGLATSRDLLRRHPGLRLLVIDREDHIGAHQSSHNSGVVHSGLYYAPGSLKARLCLEGRGAVLRLAEERGIPFEQCGKVVVALEERERPRLNELFRRGAENGVSGIRMVGPQELAEIEPNAVGIAAIHVPSTAIIDFSRVAGAYADDVRAMGGEIRLSCELRSRRRATAGHVLVTTTGDIEATNLVSCAGLWADRVARLTPETKETAAWDERIVPFRGDYYTVRPEARHLARGLIYPVPDPQYPFLGVHFTRRIDGELWAGPNAVLATARAGYRRRDLNIGDLAETVGFRGFRRLARKHWRTGASEVWRDVSKRAFVRDLQAYVPAVEGADLTFGPSGVRAQAVRGDGTMVDDFSLLVAGNALHVLNAPSPGATASLAIGRVLSERAELAFCLTPSPGFRSGRGRAPTPVL